jgi:hypothetical protein
VLQPEEEAPHPFHFLAFVKEYVYEGLGTSLWRRETVCLLGTFPTERMAFWQRSRGPCKTFSVDERFWLGMLGQDGMFVTHP